MNKFPINIKHLCYGLWMATFVYLVADPVREWYTAPNYVKITEYELSSKLTNGRHYIDHIKIYRAENYALFALNGTNSEFNESVCTDRESVCNVQTFYHIDFDSVGRIIDKYGIYKIQYYENSTLFSWVCKLLLLIVVFYLIKIILKSSSDNLSFSNFTIMNACSVTKDITYRFTDVIGNEEAKHQIQKYVDFMKNREKYIEIGAKIPKGVLLCGPPGCGKTLLAKAVAGEAGVTFISVTGSDFDEKFVGVGSARVKMLFTCARLCAPAIIFIDEIDSMGENRDTMLQNKRADTLNKFLAEIDGFNDTTNVMVLASTNREKILDPALLRSGRFDSKIYVDLPNKKERSALFDFYVNKIKLDQDIDKKKLSDNLSEHTIGMSGADIANVCNQSAINAVSNGFDNVNRNDILRAIDDIAIGIEKKSKKISDEQLKLVAYHEAGHALMGYLLKDANSPIKLSIIPRGHGNLGFTQPQHNEISIKTKEQYVAELYTLLSGRGAEIVKFNKITSGASDDFSKATRIVEMMITRLGMYSPYTTIVFDTNKEKQLSDIKRAEIENMIQKELNEIFGNVLEILEKHHDKLNQLAEKLLIDEIVTYDQIKSMFPESENLHDLCNSVSS